MLAAWRDSPARFREDANAEEDLVLGGYRDRVLIELAQNAADAATRAGVRGRLRFHLDGDTLRVANTGAPIDAAGVESASTLRASAKRDESAAVVGRFGVGFAAVLAVSDEPAIVGRDGGVRWSSALALVAVAEIPGLDDEVKRRGGAVPVLRLPFADDSGRRPPEGFDTEVVLPLRDANAVALARELLDGIDAAMLLSLPTLGSIEVIVDGASRLLTASPSGDDVVIDGVRWRLRTRGGRLSPELLRDRPVEERSRREFSLTWALPISEDGSPAPLPPSAPAVAHAPTPTDEPVSLPALLIAPLPLDPTRRHVAPGPLRDFLLAQAADAYAELARELPAVAAVLRLVPVGVARGALDGELRSLVLARLRETAFLGSVDGETRQRPSQAVTLDSTDDALVAALGEVMPTLLPAAWGHSGRPALAALGVREVSLGEVIDELAALEKPARWWRSLYAALAEARAPLDTLAGLPVPLASGGLARSPRGVLLPGEVGELGDLSALGLRAADPMAAHPLLARLGAVEAEPVAILADDRVRGAVENSYDAEDPDQIADAVLRLVAASGLSVEEHPWLADIALPGDDGELYVAGELLMPRGELASLVVEDSPFGVVSAELLERWGAPTLTAVGVLNRFAVLREHDVSDAEHDLDRESGYLDAVADTLDADEPVVIDEFVAVRDLELVRDDAWPRALALLAAPPLRSAVVDVASASAGGRRARVPSYTAWWLREHRVVSGRVASSDRLLDGLYDVVALDLDEEFLVAVGALREVGDADPDDLLVRLADSSRAVRRDQARALYASVTPREPPAAVRAVRSGELVVVAADEAVVVDSPDLLPLLGNLAIVPTSLRDAVRVADALDLPLASELGAFSVLSQGERRDDHVVHSPLSVADVDGVAREVAWRVIDGVTHVDAGTYEFGLGRARAWDAGNWGRRHLETQLLRGDVPPEVLLAEADLDPADLDPGLR